VAFRMNCRHRAPVPFTPLVSTVLLASPSIGRDRRLDQHRFRPLGKLVVGNLNRVADVDDVGD
jgi:hypothetical protein